MLQKAKALVLVRYPGLRLRTLVKADFNFLNLKYWS